MKYDKSNLRIYNKNDSIVFRKTKEVYGGLSNMSAGYPVCVNDVSIRTIEALYQACRYPSLPQIQKKIIEQKSPMTAKMVGKPYRKSTRSDWNKIRVEVMRWCLRIKLAQNWNTFGVLLKSTAEKPIVEESNRDQFWGAKSVDDTLVGMNILGCLLMDLREEHKKLISATEYTVETLGIEEFYLYGKHIESFKTKISSNNNHRIDYIIKKQKMDNYKQLDFNDK